MRAQNLDVYRVHIQHLPIRICSVSSCFPSVHNSFPETYIFSARRILGARISGITGLCGNLKGERAKAINDHFLQAGVRVEAGDKSLHSLINANGERVNQAAAKGDVIAVALQSARVAKAPADDVHDLPWAKDWNTARSIQLHSNKEVIAGCHERSHNSPTVQNMLNQGRLVRVDPIKPVLKAPGAKRLKLKKYKLLSRPSISTCAATPRCDRVHLLDKAFQARFRHPAVRARGGLHGTRPDKYKNDGAAEIRRQPHVRHFDACAGREAHA